LVALVVSGRRRSTLDTMAVVVAASRRRRRRRPEEVLQAVVSVEILPKVVVVGRRCFHCRPRQSF